MSTTSDSPASNELPVAYERWRSSRLGRITDALEQDLLFEMLGPIAGLRILDVGCGDGQLALALVRAGARVAAVDNDPRMLTAASRRFEAAAVKVDLREASALSLSFDSECFDVVSAITVLCFIGEPRRAIEEMVRVLKPGGRLVIGELAGSSCWAAWRRLRSRLGHPTWRAARFWTAGELRELITGAGLIIEDLKAAVFYPPLGGMAAVLAPLDRWLGRRLIRGGAFLLLVATRQGRQRNVD